MSYLNVCPICHYLAQYCVCTHKTFREKVYKSEQKLKVEQSKINKCDCGLDKLKVEAKCSICHASYMVNERYAIQLDKCKCGKDKFIHEPLCSSCHGKRQYNDGFNQASTNIGNLKNDLRRSRSTSRVRIHRLKRVKNELTRKLVSDGTRHLEKLRKKDKEIALLQNDLSNKTFNGEYWFKAYFEILCDYNKLTIRNNKIEHAVGTAIGHIIRIKQASPTSEASIFIMVFNGELDKLKKNLQNCDQ